MLCLRVWPCGTVALCGPVRVGACGRVAPYVWVREKKGGARGGPPFFVVCRRRCPTLPHPGGCSTIGAGSLSFRVRKGKSPGVSLPLWPPPRLPGLIMPPP